MKAWLAAPKPHRNDAHARLVPSRRTCQRQAAVVASTTNSAPRPYTLWTFASDQKLGLNARTSAEKAAATGWSARLRQSRYNAPQAAAAQTALKRLIRQATVPTGIRTDQSLPRSTQSG